MQTKQTLLLFAFLGVFGTVFSQRLLVTDTLKAKVSLQPPMFNGKPPSYVSKYSAIAVDTSAGGRKFYVYFPNLHDWREVPTFLSDTTITVNGIAPDNNHNINVSALIASGAGHLYFDGKALRLTSDTTTFNEYIGDFAGTAATGVAHTLIGGHAGEGLAGDSTIAIGYGSALSVKGNNGVYIGNFAGAFTDSSNNVAIGSAAGNFSYFKGSVLLGTETRGGDLKATSSSLPNTSFQTSSTYINGCTSFISSAGLTVGQTYAMVAHFTGTPPLPFDTSKLRALKVKVNTSDQLQVLNTGNFTSQGTGNFTLDVYNNVSNVIAIGEHAQADSSNFAVVGNDNTTTFKSNKLKIDVNATPSNGDGLVYNGYKYVPTPIITSVPTLDQVALSGNRTAALIGVGVYAPYDTTSHSFAWATSYAPDAYQYFHLVNKLHTGHYYFPDLGADGTDTVATRGWVRSNGTGGSVDWTQGYPYYDARYLSTPSSTKLLSGGDVVWLHDYVYNVSAATYLIDGVTYSSPSTDITLSAADASLDRIDVFALTTSNTAIAITGTPSSPPVEPTVDASTQLQISFATVTANTTQPSDVTNNWIYQENTEWTASTSNSSTVNLSSTLSPYAGTVSIEGTNVANGTTITFVSPGGFNIGLYQNLVFEIKSKANWGTSKHFVFRFYNGTTAIGSPVTFGSSSYGFLSTNTTQYQSIVIPLSDFGNVSTATKLIITQSNVGTIGWYVDNIQLQNTGGGGTSQTVSLIGDATGTGINTIPTTVVALRSKALPGLTAGNLRYTGLAWTFDNNTYLTGNQTITFTPTGDVTGSTTGATSLTPNLTIGAGKVTNTMLAGSIAASKLVGSDITLSESQITNLTTDLAGKQATLVSGTNIKTINGSSLLGSGDLTVSGGGGGATDTVNVANVLSYGADSTGSSDATAAINAAINNTQGKKRIYLPHGTYRITVSALKASSQVNKKGIQPINDIEIFGDGDKTILRAAPNQTGDTSNTYWYPVINGFAGANNVYIHHLQIDGNKDSLNIWNKTTHYASSGHLDTSARYGEHGIAFRNSDNIQIKNVWAKNCVVNGFEIYTTTRGFIDQCKASENGWAGVGFYNYDTTNKITSGAIRNSLITHNIEDNIVAYYTDNLEISHNEISWADSVTNVSGNNFAGIFYVYCKNLNVHDNYIHDNSAYGIDGYTDATATSATIINNNISFNGNGAIILGNPASILSNKIYNNGRKHNGGYDTKSNYNPAAIVVNSAPNLVITGNTAFDSGANAQIYFIKSWGGGGSTGFNNSIVSNNHVKNIADTAHFHDGNSGTNIIANNQVFTSAGTPVSEATNGYVWTIDANGRGRWTSSAANTLLISKSLNIYAALGSSIKGEGLIDAGEIVTASNMQTSGTVYFVPIYLPAATTITGFKWVQNTAGNYTAGSYNGGGLYSYSGGTLTLVASSTDDGAIWTQASGTTGSKAFSTPYNAASGVYYLGVLWTSTATTTTPSLKSASGLSGSTGFDFANNARLYVQKTGQTSLPATIAMSTLTGNNVQYWFAVY